MIRSFKHKGLRAFFQTGSRAGIQPAHAGRLRLLLGALETAGAPEDMNRPGWRFHRLEGALKEHYAVTVDKNWRLIFCFEGKDATLVDYRDYH